ncbi:transposase [Algibacter agarivorans]
MGRYKKLIHIVYKFDYHIVWVPKYRFRVLLGSIRDLLESDMRCLCQC